MKKIDLKVNDKVKFVKEKNAYTVKAVSNRYVILTKPFNLAKTVFYTIIDWEQGIRSPNNLVLNIYDYTIQEDIDNCMNDLIAGKIELSQRHKAALNIEKVNSKPCQEKE